LRSFLGDRLRGGRSADLWVVADVDAFATRHTDLFIYDAATTTLGLRLPAATVFESLAPTVCHAFPPGSLSSFLAPIPLLILQLILVFHF